MHINNILNFYEEVKDDLKSQSTSSVRIKIMISLSEGPKKTKDLKELTGMQSSTILHGINELEKQDLVSREGDKFFLTEIGKIMVLKLIDMVKTSISLKKFQKLWLNHEIDNIPLDLLMDIGNLSNSQLITSDNIDVFKIHENFVNILLQSKEIKGVSPIFHGDYIDLFKNLAENNVKIELILTKDILNATISSLGEENLKEILNTDNFTIWQLDDEIKIAFTITDKFLSLGLFLKKGTYDSSRDLISDNHDAIIWGNKLFDYYRQQADKFEL